MAEIKLKKVEKHEPSQLAKNIGVVLFNVFANFFNWLIIIVCLFILIVGYWWLIRPKYEFIASDQELAFRAREYEDKVAYLKQLNEIKNLYKNINQADKDKIDVILSSNQDLDRLKIILLKEVSQLSKEQPIAISNIVITPLDNSKEKFIKIGQAPKDSPLYNKLQIVQISFVIQNIDYPILKNLFTRLEKSLHIMDVFDFNFDPAGRQVSVVLFTYYLQH